jgi:hypothetical protein
MVHKAFQHASVSRTLADCYVRLVGNIGPGAIPNFRDALRNHHITHFEFEQPCHKYRHARISLPVTLTHFTATMITKPKRFFASLGRTLTDLPHLQYLRFETENRQWDDSGTDSPMLLVLFRRKPRLPELRSLIFNNFLFGGHPFNRQPPHNSESYPKCLHKLDCLLLNGKEKGLLKYCTTLGMDRAWRQLQLMDVRMPVAIKLMQSSRLKKLRLRITRLLPEFDSDYESEEDDEAVKIEEEEENSLLGAEESDSSRRAPEYTSQFMAELRTHADTLQEINLNWGVTWNLEIVRAVASCRQLKHLVLDLNRPSSKQIKVTAKLLGCRCELLLTIDRLKYCRCYLGACILWKHCVLRSVCMTPCSRRPCISVRNYSGTRQRLLVGSVNFVGFLSVVDIYTGRWYRPRSTQGFLWWKPSRETIPTSRYQPSTLT